MFWSLVFQVGVALLIALVLESGIIKRGKTFFRSLFFIPSIISITVVGALFTFIYQPDIGLLNSFLRTLGLGSLTHGWLGNSKTALYAIIAMSQWQYTGYTTMLFNSCNSTDFRFNIRIGKIGWMFILATGQIYYYSKYKRFNIDCDNHND